MAERFPTPCHFPSSLTYLDLAKASAEAIIGQISKQNMLAPSRPNPIMLMKTGGNYDCLLSAMGDPHTMFEDSLKNISCNHLTENSEHDDVLSSLSFPLSYAITLLNKHRVRSGVDKFGHGRAPWVLEPATIIVITDGKSHANKEIKISSLPGSSMSTGGDFVSETLKWDHRIYSILIKAPNSSEDCLFEGEAIDEQPRIRSESYLHDEATAAASDNSFLHHNLTKLCMSTGAEVITCRGWNDTIQKMRVLSSKLINPSVGIRFSFPPSLLQQESRETHLSRVLVKGPGEWPFPESFWVDSTTKTLLPRLSHPILTVIQDKRINNNAGAMYRLAKELDILIDSYEIQTTGSFFKSLGVGVGLVRDERFAVCVVDSGKADTVSLIDGCPSISGSSPPFALLGPGRLTGSLEMAVLPFNYPRLLPLIKTAIENKKMCESAQQGQGLGHHISQQSWVPSWRLEFQAYLSTVPLYYYDALYHLLKRADLSGLAQSFLRGNGEVKISRQVQRKLQSCKNIAEADLNAFENCWREKWPRSSLSAADIAISNVAMQRAVPASNLDVQTCDLMSAWEKMRRMIYGGSDGATVSGLSVNEVAGNGGKVRHQHITAQGNQINATFSSGDWLNIACGASFVPKLTMRDAGKYIEVLAKREALRDPLTDPEVDEDAPSGVLKRKFTVNFGSKFRKSSARKVSKNLLSGRGIGAGIDGNESLDGSFEDSLKEVHAFFMDSPARETDDDDLENRRSASKNEITTFFANPSSNNTTERNIYSLPVTTNAITETLLLTSHHQLIENHAINSTSLGQAISTNNILVEKKQSNEDPRKPSIPMAGEEQSLPEGWTKCFSKRENRDYWFNEKTGASVWEDPIL